MAVPNTKWFYVRNRHLFLRPYFFNLYNDSVTKAMNAITNITAETITQSLINAYINNIASPKLKNRYRSFTA